MKINWKKLVIFILIPLAVGGLATLLTMDEQSSFESLLQPPLSPPAWLFPIAWTILYILMGIGSYLVSESSYPHKSTAQSVYGIQLFFNFCWTLIFFNAKAYLFAFIWLMILWAMIIAMLILFSRADKRAGYTVIPYLLWVTFAAYLNFGIYLLN